MNFKEILYLVLLLGFLFQSLYQLWKIINLKSRQSASQAWPATQGKVLDKGFSQLDRFKLFSRYDCIVSYRFSVMGNEIEKKRSIGMVLSKNQAAGILDDIGETVLVHYNPEKPEVHVLDKERVAPGNYYSALAPFVILVVFYLIFTYTGG